jgi:hypothetical protein
MGVWLLNTHWTNNPPHKNPRYKNSHKVYTVEQKRKTESGSATVEAAITLPLVIFAFITVLSIIRITSTYERVQHSLNQVAMQLSQYSYISTVTGIKQKHDGLQDNLNNAKDELRSQGEAIETFYTSIQSLTSKENWSDKVDSRAMDKIASNISNVDNIQNSYNELLQDVGRIIEEPKGELQLIGLALSDSIVSQSKTALLSAVTKSMLTNNLSNQLGVDSDYICKYLGINGNMDQLDLSSSTLFSDNETIDIVVEYSVKPIPQVFIVPEIKLRNRVTVLAWSNGYGSISQKQSKNEDEKNESLWNINSDLDVRKQHIERGNKIDKMYAEELKKGIGAHAETTPYHFKTIDLIEYSHNGKNGKLITIFSLNPFMPTYSKKNAVIGVINENLHKLNSFNNYTTKDFTIDLDLLSGDYQRVVYIIIPENDVLPDPYLQAFEECKKTAKKMNIELIQVQKYGKYDDGNDTVDENKENQGSNLEEGNNGDNENFEDSSNHTSEI